MLRGLGGSYFTCSAMVAEMRVAGRQLGPGVADADNGTPLELVLGKAAALEERAVVEPHRVLAAEPRLAAERALLVCAHLSKPLLFASALKHIW